MAKPGSNGARQLAGKAHDLSAAGLSGEQAQGVQEAIELQNGFRCEGCGRRIQIGFHFYSIDPRAEVPVLKKAACTREDCDWAERCKPGATLMEMVEYAWVDANGPDAPAAAAVVQRNERWAAEAKAAGGAT